MVPLPPAAFCFHLPYNREYKKLTDIPERYSPQGGGANLTHAQKNKTIAECSSGHNEPDIYSRVSNPLAKTKIDVYSLINYSKKASFYFFVIIGLKKTFESLFCTLSDLKQGRMLLKSPRG